MEENHYLNYQAMVTTVTTGMAQLEGICRKVSMEPQAQELKKASARLTDHVFSVGIMGEFRRGKSTVINALLGQQIVPADIVPCSATLNYIRWDTEKRARIQFKDGTFKDIPVEELSDYVTKITRESEAMAATVEDATVYYPCPFCQNGVQIVDTPGLNDDERMTSITEKVIPAMDAIIMVLVPDSPFSQSEAEFVRNKLMASDLGKLIFVVNKIDIVDEEDQPRLLRSIKAKIQSSVLDKMAAVYGSDSQEYRNAKDKIGQIRVLPISARQALRGKMRKNAALLEESGYPEFEDILSRMLTEERGVIQLLPPVNKLLSTSRQALQTLRTRKEALRIDAQEFESIQRASIQQITQARAKKQEEVSALKTKGRTLRAQLQSRLEQVYQELEAELAAFLGEYPITESDLSGEEAVQAFTQRLSDDLDEHLRNCMGIHTEKLFHRIQEELGRDAQGLTDFNMELEGILGGIRQQICVQPSAGSYLSSTAGSYAVDAAALMGSSLLFGAALPGVGGLISGFRDHGVKGAITGGLTGAALTIGASMLLAPLGIVGIPFCLIASAASTVGGKAVTNLIFGKSKNTGTSLEKVRSTLAGNASGIVARLRSEGTLELWLKDTCEQAYNSLAADIDKEWELSLGNMEETLTQIKIDIEMNTTNKEKQEQVLEEYSRDIMDILESIQPVQNKLTGNTDDSGKEQPQ